MKVTGYAQWKGEGEINSSNQDSGSVRHERGTSRREIIFSQTPRYPNTKKAIVLDGEQTSELVHASVSLWKAPS